MTFLCDSGYMVTLWLGGENAANDHNYLISNDVRARFSVRGCYSCSQANDIVDLAFFKIDNVIGYHCSRHMAEVGMLAI